MATTFVPATSQAVHCQGDAFQFFVKQLPELATTAGLLGAATAISMHALDDLDPRRIEQRLEVLALRVLERSPSGRPAAVLANLHAVLFEEERFFGNLDKIGRAHV